VTGENVEFLYRGRVCAVGKVEFDGNNGRQRKWGALTIGRGRSLFRIKEVRVPGVKPPLTFKPTSDEALEGTQGWKRDDTTLQIIYDECGDPDGPLIAVPSPRLRKPLQSVTLEIFFTRPLETINEEQEDSDHQQPTHPQQQAVQPPSIVEFVEAAIETVPHRKKARTRGVELTASLRAELDSDESDDDANSDEEQLAPPPIELDDDDNDAEQELPFRLLHEDNLPGRISIPGSEDGEIDALITATNEDHLDDDNGLDDETGNEAPPRSRKKSDIFHEFDALPMSRRCPARNLVSRLLIHATFEWDAEDYEKVADFLATKKGIRERPDILKHFYFNREWWRARARMYTPSPSDHARRIRIVHDLVAKELAEWYDEDLIEYLDKLERKCQEGLFEELSDVSLFTWRGTDGSGLDLWWRNRGSTRAENIHQKMKVAFGPWGVGAQTGHFLLLLISYRYNVNTGIRRCNEHNFGHPWLYFQDRIQIRVQEVFNVNIYPRHTNLAQFKGVDGFVAVGIGPLNYDEDYVQLGEPDERLGGDLLFLACRMKLVCPPVHICTKHEKHVFNEYLKTHPNPKDSNWKELARLFKSKTDCKTVFPKLPSMVKAYYNQWKESQTIVLLQEKIKEPYTEVLNELARPALGLSAGVRRQKNIARESRDSGARPLDPMAGEHPLPVPPVVAPNQTRYVVTNNHEKRDRQCVYWPRCQKMASVCGGFKKGYCSEVGTDAVLTAEELERKRRRKKEMDKIRLAEMRAEKKRQREDY
jgi:hypothetical protein